MIPDISKRRETHFVLWRPGAAEPPRLVIGVFQPGTPPTLAQQQILPMTPSTQFPDIFERPAVACGLSPGCVYHYWFEVTDTDGYFSPHVTLRVTDPAASCVDWRLTYPFPFPYNQNPANPTENESPAAVVRFTQGRLELTDPEARPDGFDRVPDRSMSEMPTNASLVIYELPTAWTKTGDVVDAKNVGVGTFRDVIALVEQSEPGAHFRSVKAVSGGKHLLDLGVNALELLPPADTYLDRRSWGYGTSNYFAPDFDLGRPLDPAASQAANAAKAPTAATDLLALIRACHRHRIRFFYDAVMAFSMQDPYRFINFPDFHVLWSNDKPPPDPDQDSRDGFGGDLWKYNWIQQSYDPVTGQPGQYPLARRHMLAHLLHWMRTYHVDGLRLDSVNNFNNWDFAQQVRDETRDDWRQRWAAEVGTSKGGEERFLVVGEELSVPKALLSRLDALWNEDFKKIARKVILGKVASGDLGSAPDTGQPSFEWSVRRLIDCRNLGFADGCQAVNYLGSHDVGGFENERLYSYLDHDGVVWKDRQIKLAFACLLTAVGIPMILAGDEFADQQDLPQLTDTNKQLDPVNFDRMADPWRTELFQYVARLVRLRTSHPALRVNDTTFLHVDFTEGKRVLAWRRGRPDVDDPVVVVANFSDWGTPQPDAASAHYDVPNWPATPPGRAWREVTQQRSVPPAWVGREPLLPWEAKVYVLA